MNPAKNTSEREPSEIELLLPWYAAGTLNRRESAEVEAALAKDPELASRLEWVRAEFAQEIYINEGAASPPDNDVKALFAKIDALPARRHAASIMASASLGDIGLANASQNFLPVFRRARWPGRQRRRRLPSCCRRD